MGLVHSNLRRAAERILTEKCHLMIVGDSQSLIQQNRFCNQLLQVWQPTLHYLNQDGKNAGDASPGNNYGFHGSDVADTLSTYLMTGYGTKMTDTSKVLRPHRYTAWTTNIGDGANAAGNNGFSLPRLFGSGGDPTASNRQFPWPLDPASNKPWYHSDGASSTHMKARLITQDPDANEVAGFSLAILRQGQAASTWTNFGGSTAIGWTKNGGFGVTAWTGVSSDAGTYDNGATGLTNDHDLQLRHQGAAGVDETGKSLHPLCCQWARCNGSGVIDWNADNTGCGFDAWGIAGTSWHHWANVYAQDPDWLSLYYEKAVLVPDSCTVQVFLLGHNADATELTGGYVNDTYIANALLWIERCRSAHAHAFPSATHLYFPVVAVPWRSGQDSQMRLQANADAVQSAAKAIAAQAGAGFMSLYEYFGQEAPFYFLHPTSETEGNMIAAAFMDILHRATDYRYHPGGTRGMVVGGSNRLIRG